MGKKESSTTKRPTAALGVKTPTAPTTQTGNAASPPHDEVVAEKAYYMYLEQGLPKGLDVEHWLRAEAAVEAYQVRQIAAN
jgi:hypothetical protein